MSCFLPPGFGLGAIAPKEPLPGVPEEMPVEQPKDQAMTRAELEKGLDLIQGLLDEQMAESEKREQAVKLAVAASVPWLPQPPRNEGFPAKPRRARHLNKKSRIVKWCCCSDECCESDKSEGEKSF